MKYLGIILCSLFIISCNGGSAVQPVLKDNSIMPGQTWCEPVTGIEFVWVEGGCFKMGNHSFTPKELEWELPVHEVCLDGFWMSRYEVTNAQYRRFRPEHDSGFVSIYKPVQVITQGNISKYNHNPSSEHLSLNENNQPVTKVSWLVAKRFTQWLTRQNNGQYNFRLPTEAEWEYACRAGTKTKRYWGDNLDEACQYANVRDKTNKKLHINSRSYHGTFDCDDGYPVTSPVGSFKPNAFGLYDMMGNVAEWCEDWVSLEAYTKYKKYNPVVTKQMDKIIPWSYFKVVRGGYWDSDPVDVRSAARGGAFAYELPREYSIGIRLVRER